MSLRKRYPYPYIAREGHPYIILLILTALGLSFLGWLWLNILLFILIILVIQFFRDPVRNLPDGDDNHALCPADGRVVAVVAGTDPYRQQQALKISIFMNVFNVHVNRMPAGGVIEKVEYFAGSFVNAALDKASSDNERNAVLLRTGSGAEITVVQIAGLIARRILCYARQGDNVERGERYGFIRFGSRVDIYLPSDAEPRVALGDKVRALTSVLAVLPARAKV